MPKRNVLTRWLTRAVAPTTPEGVLPPSRQTLVNTATALTLSTVYRAVFIHAAAACQISIGVERNGLLLPETPALIRQPDLDESLSAFVEYTVTSLYLDGNAFWLLVRADASSPNAGNVVNIKPLNPAEVAVSRDPKTNKVFYNYRGRDYSQSEIKHLKLLRVPGVDRGLGPIQAARVELAGAIDARDYGSLWFQESGIPNAILSTDQELSSAQADLYKAKWNGVDPETGEPTADQVGHRTRVLGKGLTYTPMLLKPVDIQFLETQKFNTTQIARLMGTPASLMLAAVEGDSTTYSNVEQDWIAYTRFSLMKPLREIEEALTDILPRGQVARFQIDHLLRTDTKTRFDAYAVAMAAGFMTADEVRKNEGLPNLTPAQQALIQARSAVKELPHE
ncbi:phage portal protein [Flavobacterium sp.]|jgi:HK97 family phage portal protein|uniref:phage portal protein n=1 Tax=Flavobacterium sp. TaxID=239 RepID=UPI0037BF305A